MALTYDVKEVTSLVKNFTPEELINDRPACHLLEKCLRDLNSKAETIMLVLQRLDPCTHMMSEDHKRLIKTISEMDWLSRGPQLVQTYTSFVLNLLSAHIDHLKTFLLVMVKTLRDDKEGETVNLENVHILLNSVCKLIPMTSVVLLPFLEQLFPFYNKGVVMYERYNMHLLKISAYIPSLRKDILDLIVKNMLKLDVRVSREALSNATNDPDDLEDDEEDDDDGIFSMDMGCDDSASKSKTSLEDSFVKLTETLPEAATLDAAMTVTFNYIKQTCYKNGELDWPETKKLYRELLSSFDKYILPTYLSNNTQFILFFICSFKEPLADGFIDYLWKKVTDPMTQPIFRQISACYIGSFLARASYISLSTAKACMEVMMQWVHTYLDQTCDVNRQAGIEHHAAFYSVCQTCFYIFCFKHTQFLQMRKGHKWAESLNFQRVVTSPLNPLKYCSAIIVKTFSSSTRMHQLAFCDTIIERNNRYSLPVSASNAFDTASSKQLYSFFPFDPYLLKKSFPCISPLYKEFEGHAVEDDVLDSEGEDDFLPDDDSHLKTHEDKAAIDLLQYSVSPGFQNGEMMSMSLK